MRKLNTFINLFCFIAVPLAPMVSMAQDHLSDHLLFYASFDNGTDADYAVGDKAIYTANNRKEISKARPGLLNPNIALAKNVGVTGHALQFKNKGEHITFYRALRNMGYSSKNWSGAVSFWLQLDPAQDLKPGYSDPIQITDVNYNDAALWVDFTRDDPRDFRLGIMGDLLAWNPDNSQDEELTEQRLVRVSSPPFKRGKWTHVLMNFSGLNTGKGFAELYIDGNFRGRIDPIVDPFTWEEENASILLGLNYIGLLDELAIFEKRLEKDAIDTLSDLEQGLKTILD